MVVLASVVTQVCGPAQHVRGVLKEHLDAMEVCRTVPADLVHHGTKFVTPFPRTMSNAR